MGTGSYVVRGLGHEASYQSLSRPGVECRKAPGVVDEVPAACQDLDEVIDGQFDLVAPLETLLYIKE